MELTLKACALHIKSRFLKTHNLLDLLADIDFLKFSKSDMVFIETLNKFYDLRYDFGDLDSIGQGDEAILVKILNKIVKKMPEDLYSIFRKVFNDAFEKNKK